MGQTDRIIGSNPYANSNDFEQKISTFDDRRRSKTPSRVFGLNNSMHEDSEQNGRRFQQMNSQRNNSVDVVEEGSQKKFGIMGYSITKQAHLDKATINIQNWKSYKLPSRGKHTYLDDVIKESKKKL